MTCIIAYDLLNPGETISADLCQQFERVCGERRIRNGVKGKPTHFLYDNSNIKTKVLASCLFPPSSSSSNLTPPDHDMSL